MTGIELLGTTKAAKAEAIAWRSVITIGSTQVRRILDPVNNSV